MKWKIAAAAGLVLASFTVPASAAFGLTSLYAGSTSPIPSGTPGGFSQIVFSQGINPDPNSQTISVVVDGMTLDVTIPGGDFTQQVYLVVTAPSNSSLDSSLAGLGLNGYSTIAGAGITIENSDGTLYSGQFPAPLTITLTNSSFNSNDAVVELQSNGTYSNVPGVTFGVGTVTFSMSQDPAFAVLAPPPGTVTAPSPAATVSTPDGKGYWLVASDGGVFSFGDAGFYGSMGGKRLAKPIVGMVSTPDGKGYWLVASDGGVFSFGDASFYGSMGGKYLAKPIVGMSSTPDGGGYWLVASDGGVFSFGDASFYGSMGGKYLAKPIVGMSSTLGGGGYWLVASDGGVFSFGNAGFYGSMGGKYLAKPTVGMVRTPDGKGYWLVASDGGVFSFGDAGYYGSMGGKTLNAPVTGIASSLSGSGYWLFASDGGVFSFGNAGFYGSMGGKTLNAPVVG